MKERSANLLIFEKSPYLLQHAYNPVNWHPWGSTAFEKAQKEDKPIFLSIGYSTCHWCHVMERESFEDPDIAALLNDVFVCIKVDREERPDIDRIYMRVCQMMTGSSGWPLTLVLLPDKRPFFAATYIPPESRFGRVGMKELIPRIQDWWSNRRNELYRSAENTLSFLRQGKTKYSENRELDATIFDEAYLDLVNRFDDRYGGFGTSPKFPSPHQLIFLLHYWKRTGTIKARQMVEHTLKSMRLGGIYDQIGFGFHRYSTDRRWRIPHFEKMIYDQALLTMIYLDAYQATGDEVYKDVAFEILTYVLRDMTSPSGGFYSAEDADVEGKEGVFYLWTEDELRRQLSKNEADLAIRVFNIEKEGNFEAELTRNKTGNNILYLNNSVIGITDAQTTPMPDLQDRLKILRERLFTIREKRSHPSKDDKILTDWNGLVIAALAKASQIFNDEKYVDAAKKAVNFILNNMYDPKGRLYHRYRDGEAAIPAFIDDYAFLIWGLLELYETTFEVHYFQRAISLNEELIHYFWDDQQGGFYFTANTAENILVRNKAIYDGAYPSGNAVAALNLLRLSRMTGKPEIETKATQILRAFSNFVSQDPVAHSYFLMALDFKIGPSYEVVIVGDPRNDDTKRMLSTLQRAFIPNKVVLFRPSSPKYPKIVYYAEFTRDLLSKEGNATAYICYNYQCNLPTTNIDKMLQLLDTTS